VFAAAAEADQLLAISYVTSATVTDAYPASSIRSDAQMPTYDQLAYRGVGVARDRTRELFGQTMGLVALTVAFAALGAYIGRNFQTSFVFFLIPFACIFGIQYSVARGHQQIAVGLLFAMGLLLGIAIGAVVHYYAATQPTALYQATGSTALFTGGLGAYGYATRRDLSGWRRPLMFALLALIVFGLIAVLVAIPGANLIYSIAGLAIFGALVVFDFNRLARTGNVRAAPLIAASIFLDVFNIFLFFLSLFGGGGRR
jgi:modulator of FtsH protease